MNNADMPANPTGEWEGDWDYHKQEIGLTKREYFAAMAMQGMLSHQDCLEDADTIASCAIEYSNALLKALEPTND